MAAGIRLRVWGPYACFTRPEFKAERVSYDVITPPAAKGVLDAVYWRPGFRWVVDRIVVMKPIRFEAMAGGDPAPGRNAVILRDVDYVLDAHLETERIEFVGCWLRGFRRRARRGDFHSHPFLGHREFPARFAPLDGAVPASPIPGVLDLGRMVHSIAHDGDGQPAFFRAMMVDGVVEVPSRPSPAWAEAA